jgi:hypothetical protein
MLNFIMLSVFMQTVIMLNVFMLRGEGATGQKYSMLSFSTIEVHGTEEQILWLQFTSNHNTK